MKVGTLPHVLAHLSEYVADDTRTPTVREIDRALATYELALDWADDRPQREAMRRLPPLGRDWRAKPRRVKPWWRS